MATHTEQDLDNVLEVFAKLAQELGTFDDPAYAQPGKRKANVFDFRLDEAAKSEERIRSRRLSEMPHGMEQGARRAVSR